MRLVLVSNRLPTIVSWKDARLSLQGTAGGLTSGLEAWLKGGRPGAEPPPHVWIGWPGASVPLERRPEVQAALAEVGAAPVFLEESDMEKFYLGFCNRTLWPLFHYFQSLVAYQPEQWQTYQQVNQTFCDAVSAMLQPGDVVWIHDYHLLLLPRLLRERWPHLFIGFFLHIPFPSFEIFRLLPTIWRTELLKGMLGADLVGFHTHDYTQHFLECVRRMLGLDAPLGAIRKGDRTVRVDTFPMGIDFRAFQALACSPCVAAEVELLRNRLKGVRTVLSIDRLDYSKGIPQRLQGFARFLDLYPSWHGRVCLAMVVVPSRIGVEHYQTMQRHINELVGDINGRFGTVAWTPILYQYRMLSSVPLTTLYRVSDVALVTPLRDGMNLVAKEYLACRERTGVLILSEMAGAAAELGEAVMVNPNNADEIAEALHQALNMPEAEQAARNRVMQDRMSQHDVHWWAQAYLTALLAVPRHPAEGVPVPRHPAEGVPPSLTESDQSELLGAFRSTSRRLLLLDYDGTLVPFFPNPDDAAPGDSLLNLMTRLNELPGTRVAIVSGRSRRSMEVWFWSHPLDLAAEHGAWVRNREGTWSAAAGATREWKATVRPYLVSSAERLPGAFVEEKDFSLAWHYRASDPELGGMRARELMDVLTNLDVQVVPGPRVVEVGCASVHKGTVVRHLLETASFDFVLAIGDSSTDEDMFRSLPNGGWSIKVGATSSIARFSMPGTEDVRNLLDAMASSGESDAARRPLRVRRVGRLR